MGVRKEPRVRAGWKLSKKSWNQPGVELIGVRGDPQNLRNVPADPRSFRRAELEQQN